MILLPNGQLATKEQAKQGWPIFRMGFRPFFFFGALFSTISIFIWVMSLTGNIYFSPINSNQFWHIHEMLFGFGAAILSGFLLTAVQNWTGQVTLKAKPLAALLILWLSARFLLAFDFSLPNSFIMFVDISFLPVVAICIARAIIKAKKLRNLFFVPILLIMASLNLLMHLSANETIQTSLTDISHIMILMFTLIMCIIGGRVFPMFTANGTRTKKVEPLKWLELSSVVSVIFCILITIPQIALPNILEGSIFLTAAILNLIRALRWRVSFKLFLQTPLVSSLHISYWSICIGLIIIGLDKIALFEKIESISSAFAFQSLGFHAITVGGIGMMMLSMISRVSLGHTARELKLNIFMYFALVLMLLSFLSRVILPFIINDYFMPLYISGISWVLAYGIFVIVYLPVLFSARTDNGIG